VHPDEGGVPAVDDGRGAVADPHRSEDYPGHVLHLHAAKTVAPRHLHDPALRQQDLALVVYPLLAAVDPTSGVVNGVQHAHRIEEITSTKTAVWNVSTNRFWGSVRSKVIS
jgi:hypothetical protein